ncbi:MAG TPA: ECF-type sigma factor [Vicinamibacterales bacterium]|nr:ECF-type sigma factor [Vicinamibacterales bacterium]
MREDRAEHVDVSTDAGCDTVAKLIEAARAGDEAAHARLMPLVYEELRRIARRQMRREGAGPTLQPTALVHEAWMRLMASRKLSPANRAHFLGIAANAMRQILVERARARRAQKREGQRHRVTLDEGMLRDSGRPIDAEALDQALTRLAREHPDSARIVELRFFAGLTVEEAAEVLQISPATLKRRWAFAKAWLTRELGAN